ncbi:MAG TPA: ABC transporter ATP-binding protein [Microlunatus sp.]
MIAISSIRHALSSRARSTFRRAPAVALRTSWYGIRDAARSSPGWLGTAATLNLLHAVIPAAQIWSLERLVNELVTPVGPPSELILDVLILTVTVGLNYPLGQVALIASQRMGLRMTLRYKSQLAQAAARLRPRQLADAQISTTLQDAQLAIDPMSRVPGNALQLAAAMVTAAALCVAICSFSPPAGLIVFSALLPTVAAFTVIARAEADGWPRVAAAQRRVGYAMEQLVQQRPATELALLGSGSRVAGLVIKSERDKLRELDRLIAIAMRWELAASAVTAVLLAGALTSMIIDNVGAAFAAAAIAGILSGLSAIRFTGYAFGNIVSAAPRAAALYGVDDLAPVRQWAPAPPRTRRIDVIGLTVRYPDSTRPAVEDVDLHAERGEIIALVGANGAGKTSTVNALLRVTEIEQGKIIIDDHDAETLSEPELLQRFGMLTQEFGRYEFTVRDVVSLGTADSEVGDEAIWRAVTAAEAAGFVRELPAGLDTQLGQQWGGTGLSGGQWQRLALARIHLRDAGIWILDEPTSAIDAEAEREIFSSLQRSRQDRITIVVSHRAWTLRGMDRIYVFDHGRIVQVGSFHQLLDQPGRFADLFAEQLDR